MRLYFNDHKKYIYRRVNGKTKFLISILVVLSVFLLLVLCGRNNKPVVSQEIDYYEKCYKLYQKMRSISTNKSIIHRPPLRMPPENMRADFEQNGEMPIKKLVYFNNVHIDANANQSNVIPGIPSSLIDKLMERAKEGLDFNIHKEFVMQKIFKEFRQNIENSKFVVIGTMLPWLEALAILYNVESVTTLDYTRKKYERENMKWMHVYDYLDAVLKSKEFETFDYAASFSSIEHSGLGRFGDPLAPYGDVEAVRQVHCMLKPNSLFFLGLPVSDDNSSYVEFNARRVYGSKRLKLLFKGWKLTDTHESNVDGYKIFVLRKGSKF